MVHKRTKLSMLGTQEKIVIYIRCAGEKSYEDRVHTRAELSNPLIV